MRKLLILFSLCLPWPWRRRFLQTVFNYALHPTSRIGWALTLPKRLIMEEGTSIGNLTVCLNLDLVHLKAFSSIGRGNWITGFPTGTASKHFAHEHNRSAELILEPHSAITNRHLIDCTSRVSIGRFTTVAGFRSQILTHSIDLENCRQSSASVEIGEYCFLGTDCVVLGGASLPAYSVLAAKSLLNKPFTGTYTLYGGVPARPIQPLPHDYLYFRRTTGHVD